MTETDIKHMQKDAKGTKKFSDPNIMLPGESMGTGGDWAWIEICREILAEHPEQGEVDITEKTIDNFILNFKSGVRGLFEPDDKGKPDYKRPIVDIDYDHKEFCGKAAGWLADLKKEYVVLKDGSRVASLWGKPGQWSTEAQKDIRDKAYRFTSIEFDDWKDPETGKTYKDVLFGCAITNRPFVKDQTAISLNENIKKEEKRTMPKKLKELLKLADSISDDDAADKAVEHIKSLTELKDKSEKELAETKTNLKEMTDKVTDLEMKESARMEKRVLKLMENKVDPAARKTGIIAKYLKEKKFAELAEIVKLIPDKMKTKALSEDEKEPAGGNQTEAEKVNSKIMAHMKANNMPTDINDAKFHENYSNALNAVTKSESEVAAKKFAAQQAANVAQDAADKVGTDEEVKKEEEEEAE
jgi:hypothetical protein